jgi:hypothetical protein
MRAQKTRESVLHARLSKTRAGLTPIDSCDEYETYDARVEKEQMQAHAQTKNIEFFPRDRLTGEMLTRAITDAMEICKKSDKKECAAFWDVAEELFEAYAHQHDTHDAEHVVPWSIKVREY